MGIWAGLSLVNTPLYQDMCISHQVLWPLSSTSGLPFRLVQVAEYSQKMEEGRRKWRRSSGIDLQKRGVFGECWGCWFAASLMRGGAGEVRAESEGVEGVDGSDIWGLPPQFTK